MQDWTIVKIKKRLIKQVRESNIPNPYVNTVQDRVKFLLQVGIDAMNQPECLEYYLGDYAKWKPPTASNPAGEDGVKDK